MRYSESLANIAAALAKVQSEIKNPIKNQTNEGVQGAPKYANLEETLSDYVRPVLSKHGMSFIQSVKTADNGNVGVCTTLFHDSGEYIESDYVYCEIKVPTRRDGKEILTQGQATGVNITYLRRYSLNAMLGINGDKDTDGSYSNEAPEEAPLTYESALDLRLDFGKHNGKTLKELYKEDKQYIEWLYSNGKTDKRIKDAIALINAKIIESRKEKASGQA